MRELGSRDRVLGDAKIVKPMENVKKDNSDDTDLTDTAENEGGKSTGSIGGTGGGFDATKKAMNTHSDNNKEEINIDDFLVDMNCYKFHGKLQNLIYSTCPIIPKYHTTFGEPIERQEISIELEN